MRLVPGAGEAPPHDDESDRTGVSATLLFALDRVLRLMHPLIPHVTEEVWSSCPGPPASLLAASKWPEASGAQVDEQAEAELGRVIAAVTELRRYREHAGTKPSAILPARLAAGGYERHQLPRRAPGAPRPRRLRRRRGRGGGARAGRRRPTACGGAFDPAEAESRIAARRDKLGAEVARLEGKLANERFVERAPVAVVEGERAKLEEYRAGAVEAGLMTLREAEEYLLGLELFGMRFGLDRMHKLMTALGMPQRRYASIHVVGSNGKSSTVRFIAALLERHGLRTGSYTSPHLRSFRERIEIGGAPWRPEAFAAAVARARHAAGLVERTLAEDDGVTQFEALTAAAYHALAVGGWRWR